MFAPIVWFCLWNGLTLRESWPACQALKESFFGHLGRFVLRNGYSTAGSGIRSGFALIRFDPRCLDGVNSL
jgi:hypothetical protein